ncbi:MAG: MBL fold metallo-hydrolase [Deltaproteobacteria bacterium]|jgi:L-ascorbate metabolism protein UlaG (beta-lactamase superfamily)|nr:MBL fold metallo-hydrolase [Deltaproteobacteria bacterium]MBT6490901.1 MBL fold metallo-hydrolase [Deltaproteobacteria bacterium]
MRITKLDDYQSWMFEAGGKRIALDPWLTDVLTFPGGPWVFERRRKDVPAYSPQSLPALDALIISAHFGDHLHPETLQALSKDVPVFTTRQAAPKLRQLGFGQVTSVAHDEVLPIGQSVSIRGIAPGFPYAANALGFVLEENATNQRLYFEAHTTNETQLTQLPQPITAMMTPVESVRIFGIQFSMDAARALRSVQQVNPRVFLPTGIEPSRGAGLFGKTLLSCKGRLEDFSQALEQSKLETRLENPQAGEFVDL